MLLSRAARPRREPLGSIDRDKLNINGGSLAAGHPFGATGGRIVAGAGQGARRERLGQPRPDLDLRRRRPRRHRDHGGSMSDRYQQLVNTPIGKIVSKQIGLPAPVKLERYEPGEPVVSGPVLLGAARGGRLSGAVAKVLKAIEAEVHTPLEQDVRTAAADAGIEARVWNARNRSRGRDVQGARVRRQRDRRLDAAARVSGRSFIRRSGESGAPDGCSCSEPRRTIAQAPVRRPPSRRSRGSCARSARRSAAAPPRS